MCLCGNLGLLKESGQYSTLAPLIQTNKSKYIQMEALIKSNTLIQVLIKLYCNSKF